MSLKWSEPFSNEYSAINSLGGISSWLDFLRTVCTLSVPAQLVFIVECSIHAGINEVSIGWTDFSAKPFNVAFRNKGRQPFC